MFVYYPFFPVRFLVFFCQNFKCIWSTIIVIIVVSRIFQVVRYHSLVIDLESLPKELIPIAWTSSTSTLPFIGCDDFGKSNVHEAQKVESIFVDPVLAIVENGSSNHFDYGSTRSTRVLMGIRHSSRPHYGVQVSNA